MVTAPVLPTLVLVLLPERFSWELPSSIPFKRTNKIIPVVFRFVPVLIRRTAIRNYMVDIVSLTAVFLLTLVPAPLRGCVTSNVVPSIPLVLAKKTIPVVFRLGRANALLVKTRNCMVDVGANFPIERVCPLLPGSCLFFRERDVSNYVSAVLLCRGVT